MQAQSAVLEWQKEAFEASWSIGSEAEHCHFCHILLAKSHHKHNSELRARETDSTTLWRNEEC